MKRLAALLLAGLLLGCGGGGGGSSTPAFNIVGTWRVDSLADNSGLVACPGTLRSGRNCGNDEWKFSSDGKVQTFTNGALFQTLYYRVQDNALFTSSDPLNFTGEGTPILNASNTRWQLYNRFSDGSDFTNYSFVRE